MSDRVSAPFTLRLLRRYSHVPEASLMSSGTVPMVALAPVKLPLRSDPAKLPVRRDASNATGDDGLPMRIARLDRKSTRLNSSHPSISYAVFCLKKKKKNIEHF